MNISKVFWSFNVLTLLTLIAFGQGKTENLKIAWPEEWKIESNKDDGHIHAMKLIPHDESIEKWSILGSTTSIKGAKYTPMEIMMNDIFNQTRQNAPKAILTLIETSDESKHNWIIFKIESPKLNNSKGPESKLFYIIQGENSLYSNSVSVKEKTLSNGFVETWKEIFKKSKLECEKDKAGFSLPD